MKKFLFLSLFCLSAAAQLTAYELKKVSAPLTVDGKADAVWAQAEPIKLFKWRDSKLPVFMPSTVKFLYDDTNLYCLAEFKEVNLNEALMQSTRYQHRDAPVYGNDCCELFLDPFRDGKRCIHLVVDIHGGVADFLHGDTIRFRNNLSWNGFWRSAVHIGDEQWNVEYAIPWNTIGISPGKDRQIGVNLSRSRRCNPTERTVIVDKLALQSTPDYIRLSADIKPLPVTGSIEYGTLFSGKNELKIVLKNSTAKARDGILLIKGTYSSGKNVFSREIPVTVPARRQLKLPVQIMIAEPGSINIAADLKLNEKQTLFIGSSNVKALPVFDINDPHPIVFQGEKWGIYLRIFTEGKKNVSAEIKAGAGVAAKMDYGKLEGKNFITLPTAGLAAGEYILQITAGNDSIAVPLRVVARP